MMWKLPPRPITLSAHQLHLWFLPFQGKEEMPDYFWEGLTPDEQSKAKSFRFERDALQFVQTRAVLRHLLAMYTGGDSATISLGYREYGKPYLLTYPQLHFNVSHTNGAALLGFTSDNELGVDIENVERSVEVELVAKHFFAPGEVEKLSGLAETKRKSAFYRCWTRKESIIKALGTGLSFPLKEFEVEFMLDQPAKLLQTYWDKAEVSHWWMKDVELGYPYVGAAAIRSQIVGCHCWKWDNSLLSM